MPLDNQVAGVDLNQMSSVEHMVNVSSMNAMENLPLDFSLPDDLWGDSVWGMFGTFAPSQIQ
jgi:hypothetical protein